MEKSTKNSQKGITLIALIITIIVLLILAGVTIAQITGNENAMDKAVEAKQKQEEAAKQEEIEIAKVSSKLETAWDGTLATSFAGGVVYSEEIGKREDGTDFYENYVLTNMAHKTTAYHTIEASSLH